MTSLTCCWQWRFNPRLKGRQLCRFS